MIKDDSWNKLHQHYSTQDWIDKPNIFAIEAMKYFPEGSYILCLGDGQGQDSRFFALNGYKVLSTDISATALEKNKQKIAELGLDNIKTEKLDLSAGFPYIDATFDVVYAHLSLHYFNEEVTGQIFKEIKRVLKEGGILAVFVNSVNDPEFNSGKRIEQEFFEIEGITKRFFSIYSMEHFARDFQIILLDDNGKTYKDEAKGVHNLVRFIGRNNRRKSKTNDIPQKSNR